MRPSGDVAEWLGRGLQSLVHQFESGRRLYFVRERSAERRHLQAAGGLGTVCIYEASSPEKIREHASRADLPVTEIIPIGATVVVRPDPAA